MNNALKKLMLCGYTVHFIYSACMALYGLMLIFCKYLEVYKFKQF